MERRKSKKATQIIKEIQEARRYLRRFNVRNPDEKQVKAYLEYIKKYNEIEKSEVDRNIIRYQYLQWQIRNKIYFYGEVGLENRSKKLNNQLRNVLRLKNGEGISKYNLDTRSLKHLGDKLLEEVCLCQGRTSNYLAYLATYDERFGEIEICKLGARATTLFGREVYIKGNNRKITIKNIVEILRSCYNLGTNNLEEISLGTPLNKILPWEKSKEGFRKARALNRAIENSYDYGFNKGNKDYSDFVKPFKEENFCYWDKLVSEDWRNKGFEIFVPKRP